MTFYFISTGRQPSGVFTTWGVVWLRCSTNRSPIPAASSSSTPLSPAGSLAAWMLLGTSSNFCTASPRHAFPQSSSLSADFIDTSNCHSPRPTHHITYSNTFRPSPLSPIQYNTSNSTNNPEQSHTVSCKFISSLIIRNQHPTPRPTLLPLTTLSDPSRPLSPSPNAVHLSSN